MTTIQSLLEENGNPFEDCGDDCPDVIVMIGKDEPDDVKTRVVVFSKTKEGRDWQLRLQQISGPIEGLDIGEQGENCFGATFLMEWPL